jgi:hypothetical protein
MDKIVRIKQEVTRVIKVQPERVMVGGDIGLPIEITDVNQLPEALQALSDEITDLQENIPVQISRYFRNQTETIFGQPYRLALPDPGAPPVVNISQSVTGTTRETAQLIEQFAGPQAVDNINISGEIRVKIQAEKNSTPRSVFLFAEFWHMLTDGTLQLKGTSGDVVLDNAAGTFDIGIPVEAYLAETGTRGIVRFRSYQTGGGAAATATISIEGNTLSRWAYVQALGEFPHNLLRGRDADGAHTDKSISVDASEFNKNLSTQDNTLKKALKKIDELDVAIKEPIPYSKNQFNALNIRGNGTLHPQGSTPHPVSENYGTAVAFIFDNSEPRELIERTTRSGTEFPLGGFVEIFNTYDIKYALSTGALITDPSLGVTVAERLTMQANGFEQMLHVRANENLTMTTEQADAWIRGLKEEREALGFDIKNGNWLQGGSTPAFRYAVRKHLNSMCQVITPEGFNTRPVNQYNLARVPLDTANYNNWVSVFEQAYSNNGFIIFYGHVDARFNWGVKLNDNGDPDAAGDFHWQKVERLIQYIQAKGNYGQANGVEILPFSEAVSRFENAIDVGASKEIIAPEKIYTRIGKNGEFTSNLLDQFVVEAVPIGHPNYNNESLRIGRWAKINNPGQAQRQTAVGHRAGDFNQGIEQTALGFEAGSGNTANFQTAFGVASGSNNLGANQTALGNYAGRNNTQANQTAVGYWAGRDNTGNAQTAVGSLAGYLNNAEFQTAVGSEAGQNNTGIRQVAVGRSAGKDNTGGQVVCIGYEAGVSNNQNNLTALGYWAGRVNRGIDTTLVGQACGLNNLGARVTALGHNAARDNSAADLIAIGWGAGRSSSGANSIFLGREAGRDNTETGIFQVEHRHVSANPLIKGYFATGSIILGAPATELASASMGNSRLTFWIDEATNELKIKIKKSDGTTRVSTIATI